MTNKEFIDKLKKQFIKVYVEGTIITENEQLGNVYKEEFKQLEKELEILELLKSKMKIDYMDYGSVLVVKTCSVFDKHKDNEQHSKVKEWLEKEYNLFKEWLDNGK